MFTIKRGNEFLKEVKTHVFNDGELIKTVAWVSDKSKALVFSTFEAADVTLTALEYSNAFIEIKD